MKTRFMKKLSFFLLALTLFSHFSKAQSCHPYIEQLSNGNVQYSVTFSEPQAYVEVLARQNGEQNLATNIVLSEVANDDSTYTYTYTAADSLYSSGDKLVTRFYSYAAGQPGVFTPGPGAVNWSSEFIYDEGCPDPDTNGTCHPYISQLSNGDVRFSVTMFGQQDHLEVFVRNNDVQIIANNIVSSGVDNGDSTFTYSFVAEGSLFETDDNITTRFYSYMAGQPGVFTPGPAETVWSSPFIYDVTCQDTSSVPVSRIDSCHPYISQLSNGDVEFSVTLPGQQNYVEVFVRKNDIQIFANNITSSEVDNGDSTFTYSFIVADSLFETGDNLITRFYSYMAGQPGVFTPGPFESEWSSVFIYNVSCKDSASVIYVSLDGSDSNPGTQTSPVRTIKYGYDLAKTQGASEVRVAVGTYNEGSFVTYQYNHIEMANGISLLGGYSTDFSSRDLTLDSVNITRLVGPNGGTQLAGPRMILAENITQPTVIEGLEISGGVSQDIGGGIYVNNSNANLLIQNNKLTQNYASYRGVGGNIALANSSARVLNNIIINGFSGISENGSDMYISGSYNGIEAEVANNLFTVPSAVFGSSNADFYDNTYLYSSRFAQIDAQEEASGSMQLLLNNNALFVEGQVGSHTLEVFDINGNSYLRTTSSELSLNGLKNGLYIVKAIDAQNTITKKIVLQ